MIKPGRTNMPIDVEVALTTELEPIEFTWASSDVQLYHLGLGAGADPMDQRELRYLVDDTPQVLPTFGNVAATFHATKPPTVRFPGAKRKSTHPTGPCCGRRNGRSSPAAKVDSAAPAGLQHGTGPQTRLQTGHLTWRSRCRSCRSRRCCTGSAAIATRCTRTPNSPLPPAFPGPFCMACALMA